MLLPITKLDSCPIGKYVQNIQEWGIPPVTHVTGQNRFYYWTNYSWSHETRNWAMGIDNRINSSWIPCWMWWSKQRHPKEQKLPIINPSKLNCKQSFNWRTDMTSPWPYIKAHKSRPRLCYMYLADTSWIRLYILEHLFRDWPQECIQSRMRAYDPATQIVTTQLIFRTRFDFRLAFVHWVGNTIILYVSDPFSFFKSPNACLDMWCTSNATTEDTRSPARTFELSLHQSKIDFIHFFLSWLTRIPSIQLIIPNQSHFNKSHTPTAYWIMEHRPTSAITCPHAYSTRWHDSFWQHRQLHARAHKCSCCDWALANTC